MDAVNLSFYPQVVKISFDRILFLEKQEAIDRWLIQLISHSLQASFKQNFQTLECPNGLNRQSIWKSF